MKGPNYADLVRNALQRSEQDIGPEPPADERRLVAAVEQALRGRARRRVLVRRARVFGFAVAAALALAMGGQAWWASKAPLVAKGPAAVVDPRTFTVLEAADAVVGGAQVRLDRGMPLGAGLTLHAPSSGDIRVGTSAGTSLTLESGGDLTVAETGATQRFSLETGVVVVRVSRQFSGQRFIIDTRDAEIEVRGTLFRVAVVPSDAGCGGGSTTRLSVVEGLVRLRVGGSDLNVAAGDSWPRGCDGHAARTERTAAPAHEARARAVMRGGASAVSERAAPVTQTVSVPVQTSAPPVRSSSLAAENDLFAEAVVAKKQGRLEEAARLLGELVTAHPASPLVESALAQRMKLLSTINPAEAARAASAYLAQFPGGFARADAQALVQRTSP